MRLGREELTNWLGKDRWNQPEDIGAEESELTEQLTRDQNEGRPE